MSAGRFPHYLEEIDRAWNTAWASISDRSRLNELENA